MFSSDTLIVLNTDPGNLGLAVALEPSPFWHEAVEGIKRLKVWTEIPSSSGAVFGGWDWWPMSAVTLVLNDTAVAAA
jgi:hypothetical protein